MVENSLLTNRGK